MRIAQVVRLVTDDHLILGPGAVCFKVLIDPVQQLAVAADLCGQIPSLDPLVPDAPFEVRRAQDQDRAESGALCPSDQFSADEGLAEPNLVSNQHTAVPLDDGCGLRHAHGLEPGQPKGDCVGSTSWAKRSASIRR